MTANCYPPHPLLREPVLYVTASSNADLPTRVRWGDLRNTFGLCGLKVTSGKGKSRHRATDNKWAIHFQCMLHAEMALATLQGARIVGISPDCTMVLSHSPTGEDPFPEPSSRSLPQYLQVDADFFNSPEVTARSIFEWIRTAGPLVSVRTGVYMGRQSHTAVVEYWKEEHARLAQTKKNGLHEMLRKRPPFSLRAYDPFTIRCSGPFGQGVSQPQRLLAFLSQFGNIVEAKMKNTDQSDPYWLITLSSRSFDLRSIDGMIIGDSAITVRYDEPDSADAFRRSSSRKSQRTKEPNDSQTSGRSVKERRYQKEDLTRRGQAAENEKTAIENYARAVAEAKLKALKDLRLRREEADRINVKARKDLENARANGERLNREFQGTQQLLAQMEGELLDAKKVCAETKGKLAKAAEHQVKIEHRVSRLRQAADDVQRRLQQADLDVNISQQEELASRQERESIDRALAVVERDEEILLRQTEVAQSIRHTRRLEAAHQRNWGGIEQREADQSRLYAEAVAKELLRCRRRDSDFGWSLYRTTWDGKRALERFKLVSDEFDTIKFEESQPLTSASIPWPVLVHPDDMTPEAIDCAAVNIFFGVVEGLMQDKSAYKILIEKTHRRFHPDMWRARGILHSVRDDNLRGRLEAAGMVVAHVITLLWLKYGR